MKTLNRDRVRFTLKKPGHGRISFSILKDTVKPSGVREGAAVPHPALDTINAALMSKLCGVYDAEIQVREVIRQLYAAEEKKRPAPVFSEENRKLLERYWSEVYEDRRLIDARGARNELARAIDAVGKHSLLSADKKALQRAVDAKLSGSKQRRVVGALNQVLRFAGRNFSLIPDDAEIRDIRYLSPAEFARALPRVEDPVYSLFFQTLFATGARTGEAFALDPHHVHDGTVYIETQLDRNEKRRKTKTRVKRHTVIMPELARQVAAWADVPAPERLRIRNDKHADVLRAACQKAFPGNLQKHCTPKDLRHSYAIWLLGQGVSMGLVAQSLGNSETVCREHYAGFALAPESVLAIKAILNSPGVVKSVDTADLKSAAR